MQIIALIRLWFDNRVLSVDYFPDWIACLAGSWLRAGRVQLLNTGWLLTDYYSDRCSFERGSSSRGKGTVISGSRGLLCVNWLLSPARVLERVDNYRSSQINRHSSLPRAYRRFELSPHDRYRSAAVYRWEIEGGGVTMTYPWKLLRSKRKNDATPAPELSKNPPEQMT